MKTLKFAREAARMRLIAQLRAVKAELDRLGTEIARGRPVSIGGKLNEADALRRQLRALGTS